MIEAALGTHAAVFHAAREFLPDPRTVPLGRHFLREQLAGWGLPAMDSAELLTSELLANSVLHARSRVCLQLELRRAGRVLRISVSDEDPRFPERDRTLDLHALGGRGIALVEALSARWGVQESADGLGKTVWFDLTV